MRCRLEQWRSAHCPHQHRAPTRTVKDSCRRRAVDVFAGTREISLARLIPSRGSAIHTIPSQVDATSAQYRDGLDLIKITGQEHAGETHKKTDPSKPEESSYADPDDRSLFRSRNRTPCIDHRLGDTPLINAVDRR